MRKVPHFLQASVGEGAQYNQVSSFSLAHLRGLQALWGHLAPLPAIAGLIDWRDHPNTESRGQLQRPPAHFLSPGVPFRTKGTFPFHSLHTLLPFCKQVKDVECVRLLPVIYFSLLPSRPHGERGWEAETSLSHPNLQDFAGWSSFPCHGVMDTRSLTGPWTRRREQLRSHVELRLLLQSPGMKG
ncbi:uncharacterized protein LOC130173325 isoform X2 [Seriola aureovittata]|uniref:uncharacterized protein LOC130173325 isoform X2 n=1 Tax=Seriola aureovittata TaxID=2871759 RepID=UPI0024BEA348|nr:uncharacterized protein LOC130173325 isoform X2 [Seriola aureovittata]